MLSNNQLKHIRSLHLSKFRKEYRLFLAEGPKLVEELLNSRYTLDMLLATESWIRKHGSQLPEMLEVLQVSNKELERISTLKTPNDVVAVVQMPEKKPEPVDAGSELVLVLDEIRDPGNMGTMIRTADWFGIPQIICSPGCVEQYNPKVVQASMGSVARVDVLYLDLPAFFSELGKSIPVYGALLEGKNMYTEHLTPHGYLVVGSESHGISKKLLSHITKPLSIPVFQQRKGIHAESLNASVAAAILCAEFRRISK